MTSEHDFRSTLLHTLTNHCRQLRPILLQGAIDTDKWTQVNHFLALYSSNGIALGDAWHPFVDALREEARSISFQSALITKTLAQLADAGGDKSRSGRTIVHRYHDLTRENAADVIIAYSRAIDALGDAEFASDFACAASRMRDAMREARRRRPPID